ncbi:MAG: tRNA (adenosine(37)-N6)-dimethylallyltransferase MiaA [Thermovirgaceae bacterium]|nr:tRNA (adenosine(37)-N6)-dimethylallyltransferase MiaA [Thermovirgaceae bacterium]
MKLPCETKEILAVIGPTASGKTFFSLELAKGLDGEVVSVDSRQVYRFMNVGTDKISPVIRREIPHHMIDVADPDNVFTAADFVSGATEAINGILARGRTPILAGGTPFYFNALFSGVLSDGLERWQDVRSAYESLWLAGHSGDLYEKLRSLDPVYAERIHPNDAFRVIRALSIIEKTGRTPTWWRDTGTKTRPSFRPFFIALYPGRENLYKKIEERVSEQFAAGYPDEVKWLLARGYHADLPSMRGFGYRELAAFHAGKISLSEAREGDIRSTKAFVRRQMTWFRKFSPALWYYVSCSGIPDQARNVIALWKERHWKLRKKSN